MIDIDMVSENTCLPDRWKSPSTTKVAATDQRLCTTIGVIFDELLFAHFRGHAGCMHADHG